MRISKPAALAAALLALALTGCRSVTLDLTPNPIVVGLFDTKATIHAHVVSRGYGSVPFDHVRFTAYDAQNNQLLSTTEAIDSSGQTMVMDRDYTVPINGAAVALSGTRYIMVRILDPSGNELAARKLDVVVHALKDFPLPRFLQPNVATPAPTTSP